MSSPILPREGELKSLAGALREAEAQHSRKPGEAAYEASFSALEARLATESRHQPAQNASQRFQLARYGKALAWVAAAAALICLGWFSTDRYLGAAPLSFQTAGVKLSEGSYLRLEPGQSGRLSFSEGTISICSRRHGAGFSK